MKDEPEIVRELRKEELSGVLYRCNHKEFCFQINTNDNEKEKIKQELSNSDNRFKEIFDSSSDFLVYLESEIILYINKAALKLGGWQKKDIIGKSFINLKGIFEENNFKIHIDSIKKAYYHGDIVDYETDVKSDEGHNYRYLFSAECIKEYGTINGILIRGRDITQLKKSYDELSKLEEKYRILAETSADGVITIDPLGRITYINPSFEKMCKKNKSQLLSTLFRDVLTEDSIYLFQQVFIDSRKKGEKIENIELEIISDKESIIPVEVNIAPFSKENKFGGMVCTIRDITERRIIEDELKKSEQLKTEFMNIAAHELKSPITPIKGYLELIISDKNSNEEIKKWAKISFRNTQRLLLLINDILDVSRLDSDTMRFEMKKINLSDIIDEITEDMKPSFKNKNLKIIKNIPKDIKEIIGDKHRLAQVLKNILINAIKFTDSGYVKIEAKEKEGFIIVSIKDTGIGISKSEINKIFNKFYQAYTRDDRKNEGTGLGLFICKEILHRHNSEIWVESEIGKGSTFYLSFPYLQKR
jgi:PAS domain S-box-containing protein